MKKVLLSILVFCLMVGAAIAYPTTTGTVTDTPQAGLWETHLSANQTHGALCVIGGNEFKYVTNNSTVDAWQGEPAWYDWAEGNDYEVTFYESSNFYDAFAGIWYCDRYGSTEVTSGEAGWIQTRGVGEALVSQEGTAVAAGDVLAGSTMPNSVPSLTATSGQFYLVRDHASYTTNEAGGVSGPLSTTEVSVLNYPKALDAYTTTSPGFVTIHIRP